MSNLSLNTGLKALLSARFVLDTVGHNLTNANTPGYSRQRVNLQAALALPSRGQLIGTGVDIGNVERSVDELLNGRIANQRSVLGQLDSRLSGLSELESFFGAVGEGTFSGLFDGFFTSVSDLTTSPNDAILQTGLVQSSRTLTSRFHEIGAQLGLAQREAGSELRSRANEVNGIAADIAALNVEITKTRSTGVPANDLLDKRDSRIRELSELVDVTTITGASGTVGVLVAGNTLVGQSRANELSITTDGNGDYQIELAGSQGYVPVTGGSIGGLLEFASGDLPEVSQDFDRLANNLILAVNRLHSTGLPQTGAFTILTGSNALQDFDGDGNATDELLSNAGLPFDVSSGALHVNVENLATGQLEKHKIEISETHTTAEDFIEALNEIPNLTADIDSSGRVRILSDSGFGFDFSKRLVENADSIGSFGGAQATLSSLGSEPFALADGDTLMITADPSGTPVSFTIPFDQADFAEISQATAEEIAAVINADPNAQANGIVADSSGSTLVLKTLSEGPTANFEVNGGSAATGLGWAGLLNTTITGQSTSVEPQVTGRYTGTQEARYTFRPNMDGTIGTTPGLEIEAFNEAGDLVGSVNVGSGYVPGTKLDISDGISVSFGFGELSATHGDSFGVDLVPDSDTSDILVALGLNGFFQGSSASDIEIRKDIAADPTLISSSISGSGGDSDILIELLSVKEADQAELSGSSIGQFYGDIVAELGFQTSSTRDALVTNDALIQSLEQRRDAVSGVDVDEELIDLVAFEQAFQAASRFIGVISELNDELLALI